MGSPRLRGQPDGAPRAGPLPRRSAGLSDLLALDDQAAGERVGLDHALPLAERSLEPAAAHPVLSLRSALLREVHLVPELAAVGGVAQLERALRVAVQPQLAPHRLGAEMAVARADARPVEAARRRLEFHLRRGARCSDDRVPRDGMEPHRARDVLDPGIAGDHLQVDLPHARELHVSGHGADAYVADPLRGHVARPRSEVEAASAGKLDAELPTAQRTAAAEGGLDAIAEGIESDVLA